MDDESLSTSIAEHESHRHSRSRSETVVRDANSPNEHDGRSNKETFFYHDDGPTRKEDEVWKFGQWYPNKWEWFKQLDQGHHSEGADHRRHRSGAKHDLRTWMNQLHCQDHQIEWGCQIYDSTPNDSSEDGYVGTHCTEAVLLAIITVVLNRDVNRKVRDEDHFQELRSNAVVSKDQIRSVRKKVRKLL